MGGSDIPAAGFVERRLWTRIRAVFVLPRMESAARFYLLLSLPILLLLNVIFIPFHAPDDYDHVKRAYSLLHGNFRPLTEPGTSSGGNIDSGLAAMIEAQKPIINGFDNQSTIWGRYKGDPPTRERPVFHWTHSVEYSSYPAVAYLPLIYLPQSIALWIGEQTDASINASVFAARLLNGVAAAAIIAWALARMPFGAGLTLTILFLPKTLLQFASNSADPLIHAITLATIVFSLGAITGRWTPRTRDFALLSAGLVALFGVRPPLMPIALLPLVASWQARNRWGGFAIMASMVIALAWIGLILPHVTDLRCGPTGSLFEKATVFAREGPALIFETIRSRFGYYVISFIGELGWGDGPGGRTIPLSLGVYPLAIAMISLATISDTESPDKLSPFARLIPVACALGVVLLIFFAMYTACTAPGGAIIGGVQGRYFVSAALLISPAISGLRPSFKAASKLFGPCLLVFAIANAVVLAFEGYRIYGIG